VVSKSFRKIVTSEYGLPESKIVHIPNGVDLGRFHPRNKGEAMKKLGDLSSCFKENSYNILYSGTILPRIDLETPVQAVRRLRREGLSIGIVVSGAALDATSSHVLREYQLLPFFKYLGNIRRELVPYLINCADACIAPYRLQPINYGITLKMLEYLACGKRLFATPIPDLIKQFPKYVTVYHNTDELAIELRKYLAEKAKQGSCILPSELEQFSWDVVAERYINLLEEICG
jgi:glycosyltransferase involved in cell wall biosynthesis